MRLPAIALAALFLLAQPPVQAAATPRQLVRQVGFDAQVGQSVPLDLAFDDALGRRAPLSMRAAGTPIALMFGYYRCHTLCSTALDAFAHAASTAGLRAGRDYALIFIDIDPREGRADASRTAASYARAFPDAGRWHFVLAGAALADLARAVGLHYLYDAATDQYAHPAGIVLLTAQGRVSGYLPGVALDPHALRDGLRRARGGLLTSTTSGLLQLCFRYDPAGGRHGAVIMRALQLASLLLLPGLFCLIAWRRRQSRASA